jgi:hypothetical protein
MFFVVTYVLFSSDAFNYHLQPFSWITPRTLRGMGSCELAAAGSKILSRSVGRPDGARTSNAQRISRSGAAAMCGCDWVYRVLNKTAVDAWE